MSEASSEVATTEEAGTVNSCDSCKTTLPLVAPGAGEAAARWVCAQCGTDTSGLLDTEADEQIAGNVRLSLFPFDRSALAAPSKELLDFVSNLDPTDGQFEERRDTARRNVSQTVAVQALDDQYRPNGDPFLAISVDVSRQGIALIHSEPMASGLTVLELTAGDGKRLQIVMHVCRQSEMNGFHQAAGPMQMRIGADSN